ncbi:MAG: single-stranded-DNA-specific exonuclease RecJ [Anaerolineales bacterium]|nr:single-stranded-DNA-specific exonuclease RecJ [Anaerolineae bacterium]PWB53824.1 MAG: single-stranded-DNA-specific exonuclease RecJ [Anaerolineales bacterium]
MPIITKRWEVAPVLPHDVDQELSGYPPILRQLLFNRSYTTHEEARIYLEAQAPPGCEPANMLDVPKAAERISYAIQHQEKIIVYGDYDADGVTATALLTLALRSLGADVEEYIPNRFDEGYGLNLEAIRSLSDKGARLVITVDCGIRSWDEAEYARSLGLDLIITDHHHPLDELPPAFAVVNPKQSGDVYPEKNLSGVGLAYKLVEALALSGQYPALHANDYLDLVALGTVADLVPLTGENRALVRSGLELIRQPIRQGMMALIGVSGLIPARITTGDISFMLAPRLNASGRLESALASLHLLTAQDPQQAGQLAQWLEIQNRERQKITREIQAKAEAQIITDEQIPLLLFAADAEYNPGVVGLAASRLTEQYYRPSIIAHFGEDYTRASCRSIPEFHITNALDQCKELLEHHGGHAAAAGFTVRNDLLQTLIERLRAIAFEQLGDLDLRPKITAELEIPLSELRPELLKYTGWLQPTGMGNPAPIFMSRDLRVVRQKAIGTDNAHLKMVVTDDRITFDAIAFRQGHWIAQLPPRVDLMYTFEVNEFNGQVSLQLNVKDIRATQG